MTRMEPFLAPGTVRSPLEKKWSLFRRSVLLYLKIFNCRISQLKVPSLSVQLGQGLIVGQEFNIYIYPIPEKQYQYAYNPGQVLIFRQFLS